MKKIHYIFMIIFLSVFFSCNTPPEVSSVDIPEEVPVQTGESFVEEKTDAETVPESENVSEDNTVPFDDEVSIVVPEETPEIIDIFELAEPEIEFPEENPMEYPELIEEPEITLVPAEIPEIFLQDVPIPAEDNEDSAFAEPLAETQSSEPEPIPEPPAFLRPAEPIIDDTVVRETLPVPINPIPELPVQPVPDIAKDEIVFSRIVRATVGQIIEVPFRGTGWVYLGELGSRRGVSYDSRRLDPEGQSFIFLAEQPGTYILKFFKEDFIRDYIINDHVQVIIEDAPEPTGTGWFNPPSHWDRVIAEPRWPETDNQNISAESSGSNTSQNVPERLNTEAAVSDEGIVPVVSPRPADSSNNIPSDPESDASTNNPGESMPKNALPEEYVQKAQEEFNAGRIAQAISILEQFRQNYPSGSDEAFWLLGQFYEANSPSRDIRTSLNYYRRMTNEYPQSKHYSDAKARIAYLERFYLNLR